MRRHSQGMESRICITSTCRRTYWIPMWLLNRLTNRGSPTSGQALLAIACCDPTFFWTELHTFAAYIARFFGKHVTSIPLTAVLHAWWHSRTLSLVLDRYRGANCLATTLSWQTPLDFYLWGQLCIPLLFMYQVSVRTLWQPVRHYTPHHACLIVFRTQCEDERRPEFRQEEEGTLNISSDTWTVFQLALQVYSVQQCWIALTLLKGRITVIMHFLCNLRPFSSVTSRLWSPPHPSTGYQGIFSRATTVGAWSRHFQIVPCLQSHIMSWCLCSSLNCNFHLR
jgi:hypothetical protein